jgi:hypothetical protein
MIRTSTAAGAADVRGGLGFRDEEGSARGKHGFPRVASPEGEAS